MTTVDKIVSSAVDRHFQPPNAARSARRQIFICVGTVVLFLSALDAPPYLTTLLSLWIAWRTVVLLVLVTLGPRLADELTLRLNALPPSIRVVLDGGDGR